MRYIEWKYARVLADFCGSDEDEAYMTYIWQGAKHANTCLHMLYEAPLWMEPDTARTISDEGLNFLRDFKKLASMAYKRSTPRYQIVTKLHFWAHICWDLRLQADTGHPVLNPLAYSCQMDEDYVGKICSLSRYCHGRTIHSATLQKYKINLALRV